MADEGFKRKLAAILSADVEGYNGLMDDDEATVLTLTSYRTAMSKAAGISISGMKADSQSPFIHYSRYYELKK
jgi:hypothetical protein